MDYENKDFEEMLSHLKDVVKRNGKNSRSGSSAARQIRKIRTMKKIKADAKKIKVRLEKENEYITEKE